MVPMQCAHTHAANDTQRPHESELVIFIDSMRNTIEPTQECNKLFCEAHRTRAQHNNNHKFYTYTSATDPNSVRTLKLCEYCCVVALCVWIHRRIRCGVCGIVAGCMCTDRSHCFDFSSVFAEMRMCNLYIESISIFCFVALSLCALGAINCVEPRMGNR